ncbi:pentapeptide repeat-containing protein [Streptomyces avermitilis]
MSNTDRDTYLAGLAPGADIDNRGTHFTSSLLSQLIDALRDSTTGAPHLGTARFDEAQFSGEAWFGSARFGDTAGFDRAQFSGDAIFGWARFSEGALFRGAQFSGEAFFEGAAFREDSITWFTGARFSGTTHFRAQFGGDVSFGEAQFSGEALFNQAQFSGTVSFNQAQFNGTVSFDRTQFSRTVSFKRTQFGGNASFGPVVCAGQVALSEAVFEVPVTLEIAAREVVCERTRWDSTATIRLRYAAVDLSHAVLSAPVAVTAHATPFSSGPVSVDESLLTGPAAVHMVSVQGIDAAHLVLTDTDLSDCLFSGAFHLDQIRLEGRTSFASPPAGWRRCGIWPARWTRRRTLAEEHHWRAQTARQPALPTGGTPPPRQWRPGPGHPAPDLTPDPEDVAALYRQLRKSLEDGKNEPGAADFYYGECEMRRHDRTGTPKGERRLLWGYWLLSGYGLRASRASTWLLAAISLTVLLLMEVGLPIHDPGPTTTGALHGSRISLSTRTPDPALHGTWSQRMTWARAEKATRVAVNSVVFRSSGQNLTTVGTYVEMASRLLEPTLLTLGLLAIRGRIKR